MARSGQAHTSSVRTARAAGAAREEKPSLGRILQVRIPGRDHFLSSTWSDLEKQNRSWGYPSIGINPLL